LLGDDEFAAWFRLLETPGIGRDAARRLLAACGSPDAVLRTPLQTLRELVAPRPPMHCSASQMPMPGGWPPPGCGCTAAPTAAC